MAGNSPFTPREVFDGIFAMPDGVNMGVSPLLLPKTQLASGTNITVRGTLVQQRPPYQKITIPFGYPSLSQTAFETGKFQGGAYFKPDNGFESLVFQIGGRLFQITPGGTTASFQEVTIPNDPNPVAPNQVWMWQSEKWLIINDGQSKPIFFDQTVSPPSRRSTWNTQIPQKTTVAGNAGGGFVAPVVGATVSPFFTDTSQMVQGGQITFKNNGNYLVQTITSATQATIVNLTGPPGKTVANGTVVTWFTLSTELPPGGMGAYGSQNWFALPDFRQFTASDQVGDSSGTQANNYRDAVLNISRNDYLAGGGNFVVPGTAGEIKALVFVPTLDASLGQGPLQVFTPNTVFTCNVPTNFLEWQSVTNPILAESMISYGGLGQWSTVVANSDTIMRAVDGIRSEILARRDFNTWGNTPISREVDPIVSADPASLLPLTSAVVFDNRLLMTTQPVVGPQGVYWQQLIALNFDPVSSLRGKAASVYDGSWSGLNIYQVIKGQFSGIERCFALCYNATTKKNELYEILKQGQGFFDNGTERIVSAFRTGVLLREASGKTPFDLCRLVDGEIYLDSIQQTTDIQVWYRPDSYPCWIPWTKFSICAPVMTDDPLSKPGYRTRIGLGEPSGKPCEPGNNRPFRTGYFLQLRFVITGPFRFLGGKIKAVLEPQEQFARPAGCCENEVVIPIPPGAIIMA